MAKARVTNREPWAVPRIWPDATVFIIGGGPSLHADLPDLPVLFNAQRPGVRVLATNDAFKLSTKIPAVYFGDYVWFQWNRDELKKWPGIKITSAQSKFFENVPWVKWMKRGPSNYGIQPKKTNLAWNNCTGNSAINVAYHFGASRIVLLGYDMRQGAVKKSDGEVETKRSNWHTNHKRQMSPSTWQAYLRCMPRIKKDAEQLGVEILNATPRAQTRIRDFPHVDWRDYI